MLVVIQIHMNFDWNIIGHQKQLHRLAQDVANKNVAHAYLFIGPASIGKTTIAHRFAALLQGTHNDKNIQREMDAGCHAETIVFDEQLATIRIEDLRKKQETFASKVIGEYRVVIIPELQRMSYAAQNAFLKTVEEPGQKTVFIMTTSVPERLLATIMSRVRSIHFQQSQQDFEKCMQSQPTLSAQQQAQYRLIAREKIGVYKQLSQQEDVREQCLQFVQYIQQFLEQKSVLGRMRFASYLNDHPEYISTFLEIMQMYVRAQMRMLPQYQEVLTSSYLNGSQYIDILEAIEQTQELLEKNINKRMLIEQLFMVF